MVLSPFDWPGVHCAAALAQGEPLQGVWIDRTAFHEARKRGQDVSIEDYEENLELHFEPLPCWAHLEEKVWRGHVADLVREIEEETLEMHRQSGTVPANHIGLIVRDHHLGRAAELREGALVGADPIRQLLAPRRLCVGVG